MKIVTCVKFAPDSKDVEVKADGSISVSNAEWSISQYDLHAVEAAVKLVESSSGKVIALSAGPQRISNSKLKKDILSRGPNELCLVADDGLSSNDTHRTAAVLAAAIQKIGDVDLVICGEGSSDLYFQQVGLQLGELLGWPDINAVGKVEVANGGLIVDRSLENKVEVLEVSLPAVISVTTDINLPRLVRMREILGAAKKPVTEWKLSDLAVKNDGDGSTIQGVSAPKKAERKKVVIDSPPEEAVAALIGYLAKEGVI